MFASLKRLSCALTLAQSLFCVQLSAQEPITPAPEAPAATGTDEAQKYGLLKRPGSNITPPALIHTVDPQFSEEARKKKMGGVVLLGLVVDKNGFPQKMHVICAPGMGLDIKAIAAVSEYRFKPAMQNGMPIEVELQIRVNFQVNRNKKKAADAEALARQQAPTAPDSPPLCEASSQSNLAQYPSGVRPADGPSFAAASSSASTPADAEAAEEAQFGPIKKVGNGVSVPAVTHTAYPEFSEEARRQHFNGMVLIGLIVDKQGMPQDVHVIRGVGMGLDERALLAVRQYRFKPAMENGQPVAVRLNVEVNFQTFQGPQRLDGLSAPHAGDMRDASQP